MAKKAIISTVTLKYKADKVTKNAVRYAPVPDGPPTVSGNIYVAKWALNGEKPAQELTVTVEGLNLSGPRGKPLAARAGEAPARLKGGERSGKVFTPGNQGA